MIRLFLAVTVFFAAAGCNGSGEHERVLHLRDYDATERQFRTYVQVEFNEAVCADMVGLTPAELIRAIEMTENPGDEYNLWLHYGALVQLPHIPGQRADPDSKQRAAEIMLEECRGYF